MKKHVLTKLFSDCQKKLRKKDVEKTPINRIMQRIFTEFN